MGKKGAMKKHYIELVGIKKISTQELHRCYLSITVNCAGYVNSSLNSLFTSLAYEVSLRRTVQY